MRNILTLLGSILYYSTQAQPSYSEDSLQLTQTIEWLESKLTYHYYNVDDQEWWINRFTYNRSSQSITIKNIASPQLHAVSDKTYLQLNFKLEDLNPYTISIKKNTSNAGRLVAGKTIRIGAYHHDKSIKKTRNGQISSNLSFLYISIPKHYEDSVSTYAEDVAIKLKEAIQLATRVYPKGDQEENTAVLKEIMRGRFISDNLYWEITALYPEVLEIVVKDRSLKLIEKRFLRFLPHDGVEWMILKPHEPTQIVDLKQESLKKLSFQDANHSLTYTTLNEFTYTENEQPLIFIRDWTFKGTP